MKSINKIKSGNHVQSAYWMEESRKRKERWEVISSVFGHAAVIFIAVLLASVCSWEIENIGIAIFTWLVAFFISFSYFGDVILGDKLLQLKVKK